MLSGKALFEQQDFAGALQQYRAAMLLWPNEACQKKIAKLEMLTAARIQVSEGLEKDTLSNCMVLDNKLFVPVATWEALFPHQRDGLRWLWSMVKKNSGGILADDMVIKRNK